MIENVKNIKGLFGRILRPIFDARACNLHGLDGALRWVEVSTTGTRGGCPQQRVSAENAETERESLEVVVGGFEKVIDVHIEEVDLLKATVSRSLMKSVSTQ